MKDRIKKIRKDQHISQTSFGRILGVSRDTISNYEMGRVEPTDLFINHLCSTFYVDENWLRYGVGEVYKKTKESLLNELIIAYGLNNKEATIINAFLQLSPEGRSGVLEYADNLIKLNNNINPVLPIVPYAFRAARSENNAEPEIIDSNIERTKRLQNAPKLSNDNEL